MTKRKNPDQGLNFAGWVLVVFAVLLVFGNLFPSLPRGVSGKIVQARQLAFQTALALKAYEMEYSEIPSGDNRQIVSALCGKNPRKIEFWEASPKTVNTQGELVDSWGTPYRFDLSNPKIPRVWSCGKDHQDNSGAEGSDDIVSWR